MTATQTKPEGSPHYVRVLSLFIVTSFLAIFATTFLLSSYLARYVAGQMMMRDAVVSMQFLNSIVRVENANSYFYGATKNPEVPEMEEFFVHVSRLPDVFRANVYAMSGEILWSSDSELIGRTFAENDELAAAMRGELHPEVNVMERGEKDEHVGLSEDVTEFIEFYIPIWSADRSFVVGAVEVYKAPTSLLLTIHSIERLSWIAALLSGAVLFAALLVVVVYSTRILRRQERRLVETERLAVVGEMASAVAHGLRNPLAAIRSCAELVQEENLPDTSRQSVNDIVDQVDRLEVWIRSFLTQMRNDPGSARNAAHIDIIIRRCIHNFRPQLEKRGIRIEVDGSGQYALAAAGSAEIEQVLSTVFANAIEAMKTGGLLRISWDRAPGGRIAVQVADSGPGLSEEQLANLFTPMQTTKSAGLGVGLALGRRIAERLGGTLDLRNGKERGVEVTLTLPAGA
ncbi:MAG: ATP-binding protein [Paracoccaceae bacterium]